LHLAAHSEKLLQTAHPNCHTIHYLVSS